MNDREIDEALGSAARNSDGVQAALLERIAGSIKPSLRLVRPLPATLTLATGLFLICAVVAIAGAVRAGFYGIEKMGLLERGLIFATLGILLWIAAVEFVGEMIPGSRLRVSPGALVVISCMVLLGVFGLLFRDYRTDHFLAAGIVCLGTGLLHAIPAALAGWWLLRRGFAVNSIAAGLAGGMLGGLAGVTMLELHCSNFEALHVLLWHTAVVPLSGAVGALTAWALRLRADSGAHERGAQ